MSLGPHVILSTPAALAWASRAPIVKQMDGTNALQAAPASAIRIFRQSYANEGDTSSSAATVNAVLAGLKGYNNPNLYLQLWCGAHPSRAILTQAVNLCHNLGFKTVGSSWFTGDYTQTDWDDATAAGVDAYAPQCYWGNQGFTLDHALRYRQFWKPGQKPVMILECGRDAIEGGLGGWIKDGLTAVQYAAELTGYNAEISKDKFVLGATPFTASPTTDWLPYNTDTVSPLLPGGTPVATFQVGPGIAALMATKKDTPQSNEHYAIDSNGQVYKSEAFGKLGLYSWNKDANITAFFPFG